MNVFCIHRVPFNKPCGFCGRVGEHGVSDHVREIAMEMLTERLYIKRSYEDAKVLMKLTTIAGIAALTGLSEKTVRKMERDLKGELCVQDTSTQGKT